jgi:hypothetical protein
MNEIMKDTTVSPVTTGAASTSTSLVGDISLRIEQLNARLERRKIVTPFISDNEREELSSRHRDILANPGTATSIDHLCWIRDTSVYLAVSGNFEDFCSSLLGLDTAEVASILDVQPKQVAGESSSAVGVSISNQPVPDPDHVTVTPQSSPQTPSTTYLNTTQATTEQRMAAGECVPSASSSTRPVNSTGSPGAKILVTSAS